MKSVNHFRLQDERDVLVHFQQLTPHIRPLLDEVDPDTALHALVMRWLDSDLLDVTQTRRLASTEVKLVTKGVLEALQTLHAEGYVHTGKRTHQHHLREYADDLVDVKPSIVLVNYTDATKKQIGEVQLADFGSTVSEQSGHALDGDDIETPIF